MAVPTVDCLVALMDFELERWVDCLVVLIYLVPGLDSPFHNKPSPQMT